MENKNIPPIGTKVYHIQHGWGEIKLIHLNGNYPIEVKFESYSRVFTLDGKDQIVHKHPTISLTEYSLTEGGFTPLSEWDKPKVGDEGWFWDDGNFSLRFGVLTAIKNDDFPYLINEIATIKHFSKTMPEWYREKLNEIKNNLNK